MFTKTQALIMQLFVSKINKRFSINEIALELKKPYPLIHRSTKNLLKDNFLIKDENGFLSINYKTNIQEIAYIESLRSKKVLKKDKTILLLIEDVKKKLNLDFSVFLIFGSYIGSNNPRDIDIIFIIPDKSKVEYTEKVLDNIIEHFTKRFHINVISIESAYEMFSKREEINILNESLNKHLLLFGAESYYSILNHAR